jgi:hypothetical protein
VQLFYSHEQNQCNSLQDNAVIEAILVLSQQAFSSFPQLLHLVNSAGKRLICFFNKLNAFTACGGFGCHIGFCVKMYNEKALNSVQTRLSGFSALYHYAKYGMASVKKSMYHRPLQVTDIRVTTQIGNGRDCSKTPVPTHLAIREVQEFCLERFVHIGDDL